MTKLQRKILEVTDSYSQQIDWTYPDLCYCNWIVLLAIRHDVDLPRVRYKH